MEMHGIRTCYFPLEVFAQFSAEQKVRRVTFTSNRIGFALATSATLHPVTAGLLLLASGLTVATPTNAKPSPAAKPRHSRHVPQIANRATSPKRLRWLMWITLALGAGTLIVWWLADHRRGIAWAVLVVRDRFPDVQHLPPHNLAAWLADGTRPAPLLLDARSEEEFAVSHLADAQRIDATADSSALRAVASSDRPIVVYCSAGYRGSQVARRLREFGAKDVANLEGGIFAWANDGFEVVRNGQKAQEVHPYHGIFSRLLRRERHAK